MTGSWEMTHRTPWLTAARLIMGWDKVGSEIFVAGSLLGAVALGVTHGWQSVAWLLVPLIVAAAIWLALLGILIVVSLTAAMRSGVNPDDEFWQSIIAQPRLLGRRAPVRTSAAARGKRWPSLPAPSP